MFCVRTRGKMKTVSCLQQDAHALGLATILTLLVIGGVERNPGPDSMRSETRAPSLLPGPYFSEVTLMDIMEAIRITQFQIDGLTNKVQNLTMIVTKSSQDWNVLTAHSTSKLTSSDRPLPMTTPAFSTAATEPEAPPESRPSVSASRGPCSGIPARAIPPSKRWARQHRSGQL